MLIPIRITSAIWEKIFIEVFNNKINTNPPNTANGTVRIIINGCINELKVAEQANEYRKQLKKCQKRLNKNKYIIF